ncbi:hypothetical protein HDU83_008614 [Entophlyctis luteolus]|nr:hypothetical protein HDU83_008614 [Entophlyctis luteolus]
MSVTAFEPMYALHPDELPSRTGVHPFLLIRADAVEREIADDDFLHNEVSGAPRPKLLIVTACTQPRPPEQLYVHNDKSIDGVFLAERDAGYLGLSEVGIAETVFGRVTRLVRNDHPISLQTESSLDTSRHAYTPFHISFLTLTYSLPIDNVYALPKQFAGTYLGEGIIGLNVLLGLGVSVAFDRGYIYLIKNGLEQHVLGVDRPMERETSSTSAESATAVSKDAWAGLGISVGGNLSDGKGSLACEDATSSSTEE